MFFHPTTILYRELSGITEYRITKPSQVYFDNYSDNSVIFYHNTYCSYCFLEPIRFEVNSAFSRLYGDGYRAILTSWAYKTIMTLVDRLPKKGVLVGLAIYEHIDLWQGAVRCGNENPGRAFKNLHLFSVD